MQKYEQKIVDILSRVSKKVGEVDILMISSSSSSIDNLLHLLRIMRDNPGHTHIPLEVVIGTFIDTQMRSEMKTLGHKIQVGVKDRLLGNDEPLNLQQVRVLHL